MGIAIPLPRLQVVGRQHREPIYRIAWDLGIEKRKRVVTDYQRALRDRRAVDTSGFDNRIHLLPGVGEHLVHLNGLHRPLIHREWARLVAQVNRLDHTRLEGFLFGLERVPMGKVQAGLRDLQGDRCFYCDGRLRGATEVDHFIPWSRHPDNAIENLVVADRLCNGDKRDLLASPEHLARWSARLDPGGTHASDLAHLAHAARWRPRSARSGTRPRSRPAVASRASRRLRAVARLLFPRAFREQVGEQWMLQVLGEDFATPATREGRRGQLAAVLRHDTRSRLGQLADLPTLIIKPERDLLIHPRCSEVLHRAIPGSTIVRFADAGHGLIRQKGPELGEALRAHFAAAERG